MSSMYSNLVLNMDWVSVLDRYVLRQRRYITVNFGADRNMGGAAQTKLLPVDTLTGFIACFRAAHPEYLVVQTGVKNSPELTGADRYAFDCRLEETAILLKCSALHVDCEGGLVHLASQLSTPCVVAFGPTPAYYYGYPRNENIVSPACCDCMSATSQWSRVCPRGMQPPVCMQAITPKILLDAAEKRLPAEDAAKPEPRCDSLVSASQRAEPGQRVCLIGALDKSIETAALMLVQHGCRVWIYIPPEGAARCAGIRMHLKQAGVRVEYGNMFNIAAPSGSFDWVFCQSAGLSEKLHPLALDECARLTADNGGIVLCQEDVS